MMIQTKTEMIPATTKWTMENNSTRPSIILILLAAGSSSRMGNGIKKEYMPLGQGSVLSTGALCFLKACSVKVLCITHPEGRQNETEEALYQDPSIKEYLKETKLVFVKGGDTRQSSVLKALEECVPYASNDDVVLIHDGARPFVTSRIIQDTAFMAQEKGAAVPVINAVDTQKEVSSDGTISRHLVRSNIRAVQTPQGFNFRILLDCHRKAAEENHEYTDDTEIWDNYPAFTKGRKVHIVDGDIKNKKITYRQDMEDMKNETIFHTGLGTDLHRLVEGRPLILGGVKLDFAKGEDGHSDGDALLHAITDALLGASGLGDIGSYFPPEDNKWKDADSALLLKKCWQDVKDAGWELCNLDAVIEIEKPKFIPYRSKVIASIARILEVNEDQVFVKAKTNEKLGDVGSSNAVKTYCTCLLKKN